VLEERKKERKKGVYLSWKLIGSGDSGSLFFKKKSTIYYMGLESSL